MEIWNTLADGLTLNGHIWFLSAAMIVAAVIDGIKLKVPNWLTYPLIVSGWVFSAISYASHGLPWWEGLGWSLLGTTVGCALLLPSYAIGGMGAGDVKLLMGCGAWVHAAATFYAFCVGAIVGGVLAIAMVLITRTFDHHYKQFWKILNEIVTVRNPEKLAEIADERKPTMRKLPYGIPITIGALLYFAWNGMLV
jgi:prepilin peptidase CpaA